MNGCKVLVPKKAGLCCRAVQYRFYICIGLALYAGLPGTVFSQPSSGLAEEVYRNLQALEDRLPIPRSYATARVGTFDALTGVFTSEATGTRRIAYYPPSEERPRAPARAIGAEWEWPSIEVDAVNVGLVFDIQNPQGGVSGVSIRVVDPYRYPTEQVPLREIEASVPSFATRRVVLTADVQDAYGLYWTVRSGRRSYNGKLFIDRSRIVGVGVFTLPALPIAVVYDPPLDLDDDPHTHNSATRTVTRAIGTRTSLTLTNENRLGPPAAIVTNQDLAGAIKFVGSALKQVTVSGISPYAAVGAILEAFAGELERYQPDQYTEAETLEESLLLGNVFQDRITTVSQGGPGMGDVIHYLVQPRFAWFAEGGRLTIAYLGHKEVANHSVAFLKANSSGLMDYGLDSSTIRALLELDPFAIEGPGALLEAPRYGQRFSYLDTFDIAGAAPGQTLSLTRTNVVRRETVESTLNAPDRHPPYLYFFVGRGVGEDWSTTTTLVRNTALEEETKTRVEEVSFDFYAPLLERQIIELWYDNVFGTVAFREVPACEPMIWGSLRDARGAPLPGHPVAVEVAGRRYSSRSDAGGNYTFVACTIKERKGTGTILTKNVGRKFKFKGAPVRVDVSLPEKKRS